MEFGFSPFFSVETLILRRLLSPQVKSFAVVALQMDRGIFVRFDLKDDFLSSDHTDENLCSSPGSPPLGKRGKRPYHISAAVISYSTLQFSLRKHVCCFAMLLFISVKSL